MYMLYLHPIYIYNLAIGQSLYANHAETVFFFAKLQGVQYLSAASMNGFLNVVIWRLLGGWR